MFTFIYFFIARFYIYKIQYKCKELFGFHTRWWAYLWFLWGRASPQCFQCGSGASQWLSSWSPHKSVWELVAAQERWAPLYLCHDCPQTGLSHLLDLLLLQWCHPAPSQWTQPWGWQLRRSWVWMTRQGNLQWLALEWEKSEAVRARVINVLALNTRRLQQWGNCHCFESRGLLVLPEILLPIIPRNKKTCAALTRNCISFLLLHQTKSRQTCQCDTTSISCFFLVYLSQ